MVKYSEAAEYIREKIGNRKPKILMILGSGLGFLGDILENAVAIPYKDIPGFKTSTALGHASRLICGTLAGQEVLVMQGRMHYYEGYTMREITFPVNVAASLGVTHMIVTNASGGINCDYNVGDIMLISDHIKFMADSPLRGREEDEVKVFFPDMTYAYSPALRDIARKAAEKLNITLREGVYFYALGPQYETPAEIRAMRVLGADAVGMSTTPEVIAASHLGLKTLGFSLITNMASGILPEPLSGEEVIAAAERAKDSFSKLILECLNRMEI